MREDEWAGPALTATQLVSGCRALYVAAIEEAVSHCDTGGISEEETVKRIIADTLNRPGYFVKLLIETGLKLPG